MTGSAFSLTLTLPVTGMSVSAGEPVLGGLHGATEHYYCPHCMSWVFTRPEGMVDRFVNLRATMLDDASWFVPFVETYTEDKLPWAVTSAVHGYARVPDVAEYMKLSQEFSARGARPK
jgi:hypothetical protein